VKKTYLPLTDDLTMISVETDNGDKLEFLNGVIQMNSKNRFIPARSPIDGDYLLIIEDYAWWHVNHFDITDWMRENLPRGEDHCKSMVIHFDTEQQRSWFLLKWS
jgi:hypothetical protein